MITVNINETLKAYEVCETREHVRLSWIHTLGLPENGLFLGKTFEEFYQFLSFLDFQNFDTEVAKFVGKVGEFNSCWVYVFDVYGVEWEIPTMFFRRVSQDEAVRINTSDEQIAPIEELLEAYPKNVLEEANEILGGNRQADYGDAVKNFENIAKVASILADKQLDAEDCCKVLMAVKICREGFKHKRDNLVDLAAYADILNQICDTRY
jgi:hypothetical protein